MSAQAQVVQQSNFMATQSTQLSSKLFQWPLAKWNSKQYSYPYADGIWRVYQRANYNAGWTGAVPGLEVYPIESVEAIINAYADGVQNKDIPTYKDSQNQEKVIKWLVQKTGFPENLVRVVMYEAYYAVYGSPQDIGDARFITDPMSLKMDMNASAWDQAKESTTDLLTWVKWLAIIGVGAYALSQVNVALKTTRVAA